MANTVPSADSSREKNDQCSGFRKYNIPLEQVAKFSHDDPRVDEYISEMKPVLITGSNMVESAMKWDLDYISEHMPNSNLTVIISKDHNFKYVNEKKIPQDQTSNLESIYTRRSSMTAREFIQRIKSWKEGDERLYLQQVLDSSFGPQLVQDFLHFNWEWAKNKQRIHGWGPLTFNLLLISMEGNVTPCHYDEQQNLFVGIRGIKRCILFPPEQFDCLYPPPVSDPHDRQSQVDFDNPDLKRFPKFREAHGMEAIVGRGDILYIPLHWWHHIESKQNDDYTVSLNFWYKTKPTADIEYPLKGHQKVAILRNIEKMVAEALQNPDEVSHLMRALVLGRYTE
uniref:Hypoxia-inducible factor 1-alpha inhibitor n=1 Tax=Cacopsylla melanoneura TaxID=428564 RepID=A0A8D8SGR9_9HEMI